MFDDDLLRFVRVSAAESSCFMRMGFSERFILFFAKCFSRYVYYQLFMRRKYLLYAFDDHLCGHNAAVGCSHLYAPMTNNHIMLFFKSICQREDRR